MKVYEKIYRYYLEQMENGNLAAGDRLPSLRECEKMLGASRTSVENAYLQLSADGYIYSVEKVGYFVSEMASQKNNKEELQYHKEDNRQVLYDLASIGEDRQVSCLTLWRRYMKSALRQEERLLEYADNQGEEDLRIEIAKYVRKNRNIICSPDEVVVGAGFQNLLQILIALIPGEQSISFPTKDFIEGATTFKNAGFKVNFRDKESHVIYVTPSYMTKWGEVMTMKRRRELVNHVLTNNHLLIEDDYQNEFVYSSKPTPSLYTLTGGENTAFLGSFSRVLLPSVRISFIILPKGIKAEYLKIKDSYNQTASKAEQIALTQFLRDGHLNRHIKKMKRHYAEKRKLMTGLVEKYFKDEAQLLLGDSGMEFGLVIKGENINKRIEKSTVKVGVLNSADDFITLLLSCSIIPEEKLELAIKELYKILFK